MALQVTVSEDQLYAKIGKLEVRCTALEAHAEAVMAERDQYKADAAALQERLDAITSATALTEPPPSDMGALADKFPEQADAVRQIRGHKFPAGE